MWTLFVCFSPLSSGIWPVSSFQTPGCIVSHWGGPCLFPLGPNLLYIKLFQFFVLILIDLKENQGKFSEVTAQLVADWLKPKCFADIVSREARQTLTGVNKHNDLQPSQLGLYFSFRWMGGRYQWRMWWRSHCLCVFSPTRPAEPHVSEYIADTLELWWRPLRHPRRHYEHKDQIKSPWLLSVKRSVRRWYAVVWTNYWRFFHS